MTSRKRPTREQRASRRARELQKAGDTRPYMLILKQERDRLGIIPPVGKTRRKTETIESDLL